MEKEMGKEGEGRSGARNYRANFHENKPKTLVLYY